MPYKNKTTALKKVNLAADVYMVCLMHALTTEKEEIMGLLIGDIDEENGISNVSACVILNRSDKQPDRVEISPEQLCHAQTYAERLEARTKRRMRVIGWYHSHPHITVWPSHVDTRTQASYQTMEPMFCGLIFSVYQTDNAQLENNIQLTCFQACLQADGNVESGEVEVAITDTFLQDYNMEGIAEFPRILTQEEVVSYESEDNGVNDELAKLHNDAFKTMSLVHIVSKVAKPMCDDFEARLKATKLRIKELESLKEKLTKEAIEC